MERVPRLGEQHVDDLEDHVQADEVWVKLVGRNVWQAMAMAVPRRRFCVCSAASARGRKGSSLASKLKAPS